MTTKEDEIIFNVVSKLTKGNSDKSVKSKSSWDIVKGHTPLHMLPVQEWTHSNFGYYADELYSKMFKENILKMAFHGNLILTKK